MARIIQTADPAWLDYVKEHVRADFATGTLWWKKPMRGRKMYKPIGCVDSNGYIKVQIARRSTYAHSMIYFLKYGVWISMLDHEDKNPGHNVPENLRPTNHKHNGQNAGHWITNSTGAKGVSMTPYRTYKANKNGKHLGTFKTLREASDAYNSNS